MSKLPGIEVSSKNKSLMPIFSFIAGLLTAIPSFLLVGKLAYMKYPAWAYELMHQYKRSGVVFVELVFLAVPIFVLNVLVSFVWFKLFAKPKFNAKLFYLIGVILPVLIINLPIYFENVNQKFTEWPHLILLAFAPFLGALFSVRLKF
ncbi:MAG TPA: hypothetical protein PK129_08380 [Cellvibrionaceae bacterium]|nr:hypothetical protein [Cellvibrionaceae bacterium]